MKTAVSQVGEALLPISLCFTWTNINTGYSPVSVSGKPQGKQTGLGHYRPANPGFAVCGDKTHAGDRQSRRGHAVETLVHHHLNQNKSWTLQIWRFPNRHRARSPGHWLSSSTPHKHRLPSPPHNCLDQASCAAPTTAKRKTPAAVSEYEGHDHPPERSEDVASTRFERSCGPECAHTVAPQSARHLSGQSTPVTPAPRRFGDGRWGPFLLAGAAK